MYQVPMIIGYRGPWILYLIYLLVRCIKRVSLPNIVTDMDIVPELIQSKFTSENICYETERLIYDKEYRAKKIEQLGLVREKLSNKFSAEDAVNCIIKALT